MNKGYRALFFLATIFTGQLGFCETQTLTVLEGKRLEANIAQDSMNRLMVTNDRILNIFGDEGSFVTQSDEQTGQIFIKPTVENGLKPLSLTLITENGLTQDLTLTPSQMTAATLILKSSTTAQTMPTLLQDSQNSVASETQATATVPLSLQAVHLIKQAILGELKPASHLSSRRLASGYRTHFLKAYQSGDYVVWVWSVKKGDPTLKPQETDFYKPQDLALCLRSEGANKDEKTLLYVLTKG